MTLTDVPLLLPSMTAENQGRTTEDRLFFLDVLKALSITAVVSFHAMFLPKATYTASLPILEPAFAPLRFCVPVFLTVSFLLMERSLQLRPQQSQQDFLKKRLTRLAIPTLFWFGVAALLKLATGNSLMLIGQQILTGEIFTGAYYLLILFQLIPLYIWLRSRINLAKWVGIAIAAQCLVFLGLHIAFQSQVSGAVIPFLKLFSRAPFFYWFVYAALGSYFYHILPSLQKYVARIPSIIKLMICSGIACCLIGESVYLNATLDYNLVPFDYLMFSCIASVIALLVSTANLSESKVSKKWRGVIQLLSKYSLGIFCINGIVSQIFLSIGSKVWKYAIFSTMELTVLKFLGWFVLLGISLGCSMLLEKCRLKSLVC
jgi:hypothetical protein